MPFLQSRKPLHPTGGYYYLLPSAIGIHLSNLQYISEDWLSVLRTKYSTMCGHMPFQLLYDSSQWIFVDKFCFFSGAPINTTRDSYFEANWEGKIFYMLPFTFSSSSNQLSSASVKQRGHCEKRLKLNERHFSELKQNFLGPCQVMPKQLLQPSAWSFVSPIILPQRRRKRFWIKLLRKDYAKI